MNELRMVHTENTRGGWVCDNEDTSCACTPPNILQTANVVVRATSHTATAHIDGKVFRAEMCVYCPVPCDTPQPEITRHDPYQSSLCALLLTIFFCDDPFCIVPDYGIPL
jgi:hypothetical protein